MGAAQNKLMLNQNQAKIIYLYHSGFAVETKNHCLIFDYFQPFPLKRSIASGVITGSYLKTKTNVYVFASHAHFDHYSPVILGWAKAKPEIRYILSSDIKVKNSRVNYRSIKPDREIGDGEITIKTYGSSDRGVSFLVEVDGLTVFHAGDLNWWHWKGDTPANHSLAEQRFKKEIAKMNPPIDITFFPVETRLKEFYALGAEYFAAQLQPRLLVPMHLAFGNASRTTRGFAARAKELGIATCVIKRQGQEINYSGRTM